MTTLIGLFKDSPQISLRDELYEVVEVVQEQKLFHLVKAMGPDGTIRLVKAAKISRMSAEEKAQVLRELFIEPTLTVKLNHPNLCTVVGAVWTNDQGLLIYDISGNQLPKPKSAAGLPLKEIQQILLQVVSATACLHESGIYHQAIRPESIIVQENGLLKLMGLGSAVSAAHRTRILHRSMNSKDGSVRPSVSATSRPYAAPEVLLQDIIGIGIPADIWAIGCLCGELATGRHLFTGKTDMELLMDVTKHVGMCQRHIAIAQGRSDCEKILSKIRGCNFENLETRFHMLDKNIMSFLHLCLQPDPSKRTTAKDLLGSDLLTSMLPSEAQVLQHMVLNESNRIQSHRQDAAVWSTNCDVVSNFAAHLASAGLDLTSAAASIGIHLTSDNQISEEERQPPFVRPRPQTGQQQQSQHIQQLQPRPPSAGPAENMRYNTGLAVPYIAPAPPAPGTAPVPSGTGVAKMKRVVKIISAVSRLKGSRIFGEGGSEPIASSSADGNGVPYPPDHLPADGFLTQRQSDGIKMNTPGSTTSGQEVMVSVLPVRRVSGSGIQEEGGRGAASKKDASSAAAAAANDSSWAAAAAGTISWAAAAAAAMKYPVTSNDSKPATEALRPSDFPRPAPPLSIINEENSTKSVQPPSLESIATTSKVNDWLTSVPDSKSLSRKQILLTTASSQDQSEGQGAGQVQVQAQGIQKAIAGRERNELHGLNSGNAPEPLASKNGEEIQHSHESLGQSPLQPRHSQIYPKLQIEPQSPQLRHDQPLLHQPQPPGATASRAGSGDMEQTSPSRGEGKARGYFRNLSLSSRLPRGESTSTPIETPLSTQAPHQTILKSPSLPREDTGPTETLSGPTEAPSKAVVRKPSSFQLRLSMSSSPQQQHRIMRPLSSSSQGFYTSLSNSMHGLPGAMIAFSQPTIGGAQNLRYASCNGVAVSSGAAVSYGTAVTGLNATRSFRASCTGAIGGGGSMSAWGPSMSFGRRSLGGTTSPLVPPPSATTAPNLYSMLSLKRTATAAEERATQEMGSSLGVGDSKGAIIYQSVGPSASHLGLKLSLSSVAMPQRSMINEDSCQSGRPLNLASAGLPILGKQGSSGSTLAGGIPVVGQQAGSTKPLIWERPSTSR